MDAPDAGAWRGTPAGAEGFAALVADPARAVVALDFDGTLAPIVADPSEARVHPGVLPLLERLAPRLGAVVVITGRPAGTAVEYGGLDTLSAPNRLVVLGGYGRERWDAAHGLVVPPADPGVAAARTELAEMLRTGAPLGVSIEDKGDAVAVHTRRAADPAGAFEALRPSVEALAAGHGLVVEPGRFVLELRPAGSDKGIALELFLSELEPVSAVLVAGDDLGDLPAFDLVDRWRTQGTPGVKICSGSTEVTELARRADVVVAGPEGVVALLTELAAELDF